MKWGGSVSIRDLEGLISAIDVMQNLVEAGAEDKIFLRDAEGAANCRNKIRMEIGRRRAKIEFRKDLQLAKKILKEAASNDQHP